MLHQEETAVKKANLTPAQAVSQSTGRFCNLKNSSLKSLANFKFENCFEKLFNFSKNSKMKNCEIMNILSATEAAQFERLVDRCYCPSPHEFQTVGNYVSTMETKNVCRKYKPRELFEQNLTKSEKI